MKALLFILPIFMLTACNESETHVPEGAVGLWAEAADFNNANSLTSLSIDNDGCKPFLAEGELPKITATFIEPNGDMYNVFRNELGAFSDENPLGSMDQDGLVTLSTPIEAAESGISPQIIFQMTGIGTATSITIFEQGSLAEKQEMTELLKVSSNEFVLLTERIVKFCTR